MFPFVFEIQMYTHSIQLQENARFANFESVTGRLSAFTKLSETHTTYFSWWRWISEIAIYRIRRWINSLVDIFCVKIVKTRMNISSSFWIIAIENSIYRLRTDRFFQRTLSLWSRLLDCTRSKSPAKYLPATVESQDQDCHRFEIHRAANEASFRLKFDTIPTYISQTKEPAQHRRSNRRWKVDLQKIESNQHFILFECQVRAMNMFRTND